MLGSSKNLVYGLVDPRDGRLCYVGKAETPLFSRLDRHLSEARGKKSQSHKCNWIRNLLAAGLRPEVVILEDGFVSSQALSEAEVWNIAYWKFLGCRLTNTTLGGEGTLGWSPSAETRKTWSLQRMGRRPSSETRAKLSAIRTGKRHSVETRQKISKGNSGRVYPQTIKAHQIPIVDQYGVTYNSCTEAALTLGLHKSAISAVLKGRYKPTGGYVFRYAK